MLYNKTPSDQLFLLCYIAKSKKKNKQKNPERS